MCSSFAQAITIAFSGKNSLPHTEHLSSVFIYVTSLLIIFCCFTMIVVKVQAIFAGVSPLVAMWKTGIRKPGSDVIEIQADKDRLLRADG